jgi:hypothetical protein
MVSNHITIPSWLLGIVIIFFAFASFAVLHSARFTSFLMRILNRRSSSVRVGKVNFTVTPTEAIKLPPGWTARVKIFFDEKQRLQAEDASIFIFDNEGRYVRRVGCDVKIKEGGRDGNNHGTIGRDK